MPLAFFLFAEDFLTVWILLYSILILGSSSLKNNTRTLMGIILTLDSMTSSLACS